MAEPWLKSIAQAGSHRWFRPFVNLVAEPLLVLGENGQVIACNQAFSRLSGYPTEALHQRFFEELLHIGELTPAWRQRLAGTAGSYRARLKHAGHYQIPVEVLPSTSQGAGGQVLVVRDLRLEEASRAQLQYQKNLLEGQAEATRLLLRNLDSREALRLLGEAARVDRVYVFRYHPHPIDGAVAASMYLAWSATNSPGVQNWHQLQNLRVLEDGFAEWHQAFLQHQPVSNLVRDLPHLKDFFSSRGVRAVLMAPIKVAGALWGVLGFDDCQTERYWLREEIAMVQNAADTMGEALQRSQAENALRDSEQRNRELLGRTERQARELSMLLELRQALTPNLDLLELFSTATTAINQTLDYQTTGIYLLQNGRMQLQSQAGPGLLLNTLDPQQNPTAQALQNQQPLLMQSPQGDSSIWVPLQQHSQPYGVLCVSGNHPLDNNDLRLLQAVASQLELVIERSRLYTSLKQSEALYRTLIDTSPDAVRLIDEQGTVVYANASYLQLVGAQQASEVVGHSFIPRVHPAARKQVSERFKQVFATDNPAPLIEQQHLRLDGSVVDIELVAAKVTDPSSGQPLLLAIARNVSERKEAENALRESEQRYRSLFEGVPIGLYRSNPDGQMLDANPALLGILGYSHLNELCLVKAQDLYLSPSRREQVLVLLNQFGEFRGVEVRMRRKDGSPVWLEESARVVRNADGSVSHFEGSLQDISERKTYQAQIEHLAYHDPLTGLPNRRMLREKAEHLLAIAQREGRELYLGYLDLDRFKEVNDSLGHEAGDLLLQKVSERLSKAINRSDVLARLGGDEFALLLHGNEEQCNQLAAALLHTLDQPFELAGQSIYVSASLGIAAMPRDGVRLEDLMRAADVAMYRAKEEGLGYSFYQAEKNPFSRERLIRIRELRELVQHHLGSGQLQTHYQSAIALQDKQTAYIEALLRWQHPEHGWLLPTSFIPIAEETGLITQLDVFALHQAATDLAGFDWTVGVNISAANLYDDRFVRLVQNVLLSTALNPQRLCLEVTETALMRDLSVATNHLHSLKQLGVRIALDDFGIGFSSLSRLRHLPVDLLKVDRSFVAGIGHRQDEEILRAILALGHGLGLQVLAEGVEETHQLEWLKQAGFDMAQGYLIAHPTAKAALISNPLQTKGLQ